MLTHSVPILHVFLVTWPWLCRLVQCFEWPQSQTWQGIGSTSVLKQMGNLHVSGVKFRIQLLVLLNIAE